MNLSLKPSTPLWDVDLNLKPCELQFKKSLGSVDRISSLPDELLSRILSLLPTKDAAATSVLSRTLRRAFTLITTLDFDARPISHCQCYNNKPHLIDRFSNFISFVDNVLHQLQASQSEDLTKFRLSFGLSNANVSPKNLYCRVACYPEMNPMQLNSWMFFPLTRRGIREIDLHFFVRDPSTIKLPRAFFTCETLEVLKLNTNLHLDLNPQVPMRFRLPNLKVFHLHSEYQRQPVADFVNALVSNCPLLEDLSVDPCSSRHEHGDSVKISAPCLRRLYFEYLDRNGEEGLCKELVLDAPNLQYLCYIDNLFAQRYHITNMDAIVEATLCIYYETEYSYTAFNNMLILLRPLVNVQRLYLDGFCLQALEEGGCLKDQLPVFHNLNYLTLGFRSVWGTTQWHRVLLQLLDRTPFLETLVFKGGISKREGYKYNPLNLLELESEYWRTTQAIPSCLKSHLKRVVIMSYHESVRALNLVKFLLGNALVLEELDICTWLTADTCSMMSTLVDLPKASLKCSIKISVYPTGARESP